MGKCLRFSSICLSEVLMSRDMDRKSVQDGFTVTSAGSDYDLQPGACYGPVIRNIYIIECCTEGFGSVVVNGKVFPVQAGDCYILLPGDTIIHTGDWCAVDGARVRRYLAMAGITSENPFAPPECFSGIAEQLKVLYDMREENDPGADLRRNACMYTVFGELLRGRNAAADRDRIIQKAIGVMEARYDQPLTVEKIAEEVGLERCYFSTVFRSETGTTPHRYLTRLRLEKACMLMDQEGCTVAEAAVSVGLDPENISRPFRKFLGITPGEYRKLGIRTKDIQI